MYVSWCGSTDPENWTHCRHISKVWSSSHMLLNWFTVEFYQMPLILLNGPFFIRKYEPQLLKCANATVCFFFNVYSWLHLHAYWFIHMCVTAFRVNKIKSAQHFWLRIRQTFPLMILMLSQTVYHPQRAHLAQQTYWNLNAECPFRGQ